MRDTTRARGPPEQRTASQCTPPSRHAPPGPRTARPTPARPTATRRSVRGQTSPVSESKQSTVICRRCTSNPAMIAPASRGEITPSAFRRPMTYRHSRSVPPVRLAGRAARYPRAPSNAPSTPRTGHLHAWPDRPNHGRSCPSSRRRLGGVLSTAACGTPATGAQVGAAACLGRRRSRRFVVRKS